MYVCSCVAIKIQFCFLSNDNVAENNWGHRSPGKINNVKKKLVYEPIKGVIRGWAVRDDNIRQRKAWIQRDLTKDKDETISVNDEASDVYGDDYRNDHDSTKVQTKRLQREKR